MTRSPPATRIQFTVKRGVWSKSSKSGLRSAVSWKRLTCAALSGRLTMESKKLLSFEELLPSHIHVWDIDLDCRRYVLPSIYGLLSHEELDKIARLKTEELQLARSIAQGAVRRILSLYARCEPQALVFRAGVNGKPELSAPDVRILFNLTHSRQRAFLAVSRSIRVGIDAEYISPEIRVEQLAARFLWEKEASQLLALPAPERRAAFFVCWTRKEAVLKALGTGLSEMNTVEVSVPPDPPRLMCLRGSLATAWTLADLSEPGLAVTLACEAVAPVITRITFNPRAM